MSNLCDVSETKADAGTEAGVVPCADGPDERVGRQVNLPLPFGGTVIAPLAMIKRRPSRIA